MNFPSELCRRRSGMFTEVARLVPLDLDLLDSGSLSQAGSYLHRVDPLDTDGSSDCSQQDSWLLGLAASCQGHGNHVGRFTCTVCTGILAQVHGLRHPKTAATCLRVIFLVVQPVHLHQHTRAARARKSANMVSADRVSILLILAGCRRGLGLREYLSTGYRLRFSREIYGSKRAKTVFHENLQETYVCSLRDLRKYTETHWNLQENVI